MSQLRYWIWLTTLPGLTLKGQLRLIAHFGDPEAVFLSDSEALRQVPDLTCRELESLKRRDLRRADGVLEDCQRHQIGILTIQDAAYPQRLKAIAVPPLVLYYRGKLLPFDQLPAIAVVGSRKASAYGLTVAKRMGYQLGICGGTVISGAARGADTLALEGALSAGGPVAAVLGNGLDIVYPSEARRLYADIMAHGCLMSEFVPGTPPYGHNFPRRNRILSGLSLGIVVVEAPKQSGSLITAEHALEQGRDVYAVPGNVGLESCEGSNQLLQEGAGLVTCGWDVLQNYQARFPTLLNRREGGKKLTLAPRDTVQPEEEPLQVASPVQLPEPEKPVQNEEEIGKEPSNPEKRIDNSQKRNYIDLQQVKHSLSEDELVLVDRMGDSRMHVDEIIDKSGIPAARVLSSLTLLEVKTYVTRYPGNLFESNLR